MYHVGPGSASEVFAPASPTTAIGSPGGGRSWREADLDYKGGRRGAKRLVFSNDGRRMVTVDHYDTFTEVPACR